ncbi:hypothetical protein MKEN_01222500 [Mycena kentingensis (nom. inval.)]|nr:hypothetical protein MKEN_01222500 [Mycena kentingensis (nom. inval.)]
MSRNRTYDDRDTAFKYSDGWYRTGTYNATATGDTGTLASSSITSGVNVTFVFPVPATAFYYYGIPRCCGGSYLICVDCDPNNRQFETIDGVQPTDNGQNPPVALFSRTFAEAGVHEIILANAPDSRYNGASQITLDRFVLTVADDDASTSASRGGGGAGTMRTSSSTRSSSSSMRSSSSAGSTSSSADTVGGIVAGTAPSDASPTAASVSASSSSQTTKKSSPQYLAPLFGGLLAGVAILGILVGIWFFLRRRRRRKTVYQGRLETGGGIGGKSLPSPSPLSAVTTCTSPATFDLSRSPVRTDSERTTDASTFIPVPFGADVVSPHTSLPPEYGQLFSREARQPWMVQPGSDIAAAKATLRQYHQRPQ